MNASHKKISIIRRLARIVMPLALIAAGGAAWAYFQATAPRMEKTTPQPATSVVEMITVYKSDAPAVIRAMGTVAASREVTLKARVSGDVQFLSPQFTPGGHIPRGGTILRLDTADYEVELKKAESALEKVKGDLAIEQGSQTIAREELRLLSETTGDVVVPTDLVLRKPQLQQSQAAVASAEADLRKARLDLERTVVTAPFNAMIIERSVNIGSHVNTQDSLVTIVDTDEYWVEALIPVGQLANLNLGQDGGCSAVIRSQAGNGTWNGRTVRATGKLSETSRMAKVIVVVSDPLGLKTSGNVDPLVLGDYVTIEIQGRTLKSVIELPRSALRDGNNVWIYENGKLDIRPVALVWKDGERVFVESGIVSGAQVIVSDLSIPVQGMNLELSSKDKTTGQLDPAAPKAG